MKKYFCALAVLVALAFVSQPAMAAGNKYVTKKPVVTKETIEIKTAKPAAEESAPAKEGPVEFPDKGWHKGAYLTANVGMMQVTNDKHSITDRKFDGTFDPAFGITFGWDIADWIGPMFQINFATATGTAGDPANNSAPVTYNGITYSAGTFATQNARQYAIDIGLYAKATLPYFTRADWQPKIVKILPYIKLGGIGNAVFINASNNNNKAGAFGGGIGIGGGCEFYIWKGFYVGLDITEGIIFQQGFSKNITDAAGVTRNVKITKSGTEFQFGMMGMFGWHF